MEKLNWIRKIFPCHQISLRKIQFQMIGKSQFEIEFRLTIKFIKYNKVECNLISFNLSEPILLWFIWFFPHVKIKWLNFWFNFYISCEVCQENVCNWILNLFFPLKSRSTVYIIQSEKKIIQKTLEFINENSQIQLKNINWL